jgi:hypothetical protein
MWNRKIEIDRIQCRAITDEIGERLRIAYSPVSPELPPRIQGYVGEFKDGNLISKRIGQTDEDIKKQAVDEVASEMLQCSLWFVLVSTCIDEQPPESIADHPTLALRFRKAAEKLLGLARRAPGFSDEAVIARGALLAEEMKKSMGRTCTNISVPSKKYGKFCQRLADDDAGQRFLEWIKCIQTADRTCNGL